jgi:hypothetical protein
MPGDLQRRVVGRDVADVLLDHELQQQNDHDHPGGLEDPLVEFRGARRAIPGRLLALLLVLLRQHPGDAVVLAHHQDVERGAADGGVPVLEADGEEELLLPVADAGEQDVEQEVLVVQARELRLDREAAARRALEQERRVLLPVDLLRLEPPALKRAQRHVVPLRHPAGAVRRTSSRLPLGAMLG